MDENYADEIDSEERVYRKFIIISESADSKSEKENSPVKKPKTSKQQFDMRAAFTNDNTEEALEKTVFTTLWGKLAEDLNQIGPPKRTSTQWRRVWSLFKYDKKRSGRKRNAIAPIALGGKSGAPQKSFRCESIAIGNSSNEETPRNISEPVGQPVVVSPCEQIVDENYADEIDSEEEAYRKFIVICESESADSKSDKENSTVKNPNTSKQQFDMIAAFTKDNTEKALGKLVFATLWEKLTEDLNQIGPPKRTSTQWRRVWSRYKYNRKASGRKHNASEPIAREISSLEGKSGAPKMSCRRESIAVGNSSNEETPRNISEPVDQPFVVSSCEQIVAQLGILADKQNEVIQSQVAIMEKIDKSNKFLERIAEKP